MTDSKEARATCVHCPDRPPFVIAELPMPLGKFADVLRDAHCPHCGAGSASLRMAFRTTAKPGVSDLIYKGTDDG